MKVERLLAKNQDWNWFDKISRECSMEYPISMIDISSDELVIDAGCNVGGFAEAFKNRFTNFLAIDASSYNISQYQMRFHHPTLQKAVWSKDNEIVELRKYIGDNDSDTNSGNFGVTGFVNQTNNHGYRSENWEEVKTISLETLLAPYESIGLLKVDVEGAEFDFLYGKDLSKIKWITGEFHNWLFQYDDRGVELLEWIGTTHEEVYSMGDGVNTHYTKLWKKR